MCFLAPKQHSWLGLVLLLTLLSLHPGFSQANEASAIPEADDVVRRLLERAKWVASSEAVPRYTYQSRSILQQLKGNGKVIHSQEKHYRVDLVSGYPIPYLTKIKGKELSEEELERERKEAAAFWSKFTSLNMEELAARKETWLTSNLLARYEFQVKERITLSNRSTLVLTFRPKSGKLPVEGVHDRLLNRLGGRIWLDEQDADVAKVSIGLVDNISMGWFGLLGSLSKCNCTIERTRLPGGVWAISRETYDIQLRKLASTKRYLMTEVSSDYKRALPKPVPVATGVGSGTH
jgi:hypothetical protein